MSNGTCFAVVGIILGFVGIGISVYADHSESLGKDPFVRYEYLKDHRTGICFVRAVGSLASIDVVPCTPEVERLTVNPSLDGPEG